MRYEYLASWEGAGGNETYADEWVEVDAENPSWWQQWRKRLYDGDATPPGTVETNRMLKGT